MNKSNRNLFVVFAVFVLLFFGALLFYYLNYSSVLLYSAAECDAYGHPTISDCTNEIRATSWIGPGPLKSGRYKVLVEICQVYDACGNHVGQVEFERAIIPTR